MNSTKIIYYILFIINLYLMPFLLHLNLIKQNYYLFFLLILMNCYYLYSNCKGLFTKDKLVGLDYILLVLASAIPTAVYIYHIHDYSLWLDEYTDFLVVSREDILSYVSTFQQPPIGSYWRKIGVIVFGNNEVGIRSASVAGQFIFLVVMYMNLKKITKDSVFSFLGIILLGLNIWIIAYSDEARPYSISLFYFSIFLYFLIDYYQNFSESMKYYLLINIVFSALLWLLSISMQPSIFIMLLFFAVGFVYLKSRKRIHLYLLFSLGLSCVLYFPFLLEIVSNSKSYLNNKPFDGAAVVYKFARYVWFLKTTFFNDFYYIIISNVMFVITLMSIAFGKGYRRNLAYLFLFTISYLLLLIVLFEVLISWQFNVRYMLTIVPMVYFLFFCALHFGVHHKYNIHQKIVLVILVLMTSAAHYTTGLIKLVKTDWRELYSIIDKKTDLSGRAYIISFCSPEVLWCDEFFIAPEIYPTIKLEISKYTDYSIEDGSWGNDFLFNDFHNNSQATQIYFIILKHTLDKNEFDKIEISNSEKIYLDSFYVIKVNTSDVFWATKVFYKELDRVMTLESKKFKVYDGLFLVAMHENDCKQMHIQIDLIRKLVKPSDFANVRLVRHQKNYDLKCK
ncbi:MAG: glycosyltransferase family 39 protein [Pseudobdellovibrio sp.]